MTDHPHARRRGGPRRPCGRASLALCTLLLPWAVAADPLVRTWRARDGLPHESIEALAQTPDGFLWLATPVGLVRFDGREFLLSQPFGPGTGDAPRSLITDPAGALWLLSRNGELRRRIGGRLLPVTLGNSQPPVPVRGIYTDGVKLVLATDPSARVWRWDNSGFVPWLDAGGVATGEFVGINVDRSGRVWARHDATLSWSQGAGWTQLPPPAGAPGLAATKTAASQDGGIWIARRDEARRFGVNGWEASGVPFPQRVAAIQCFLEDRRGNLWLSTGNDGLWRIDSARRTRVLTRAQGLASDQVRQVLEDLEGNCWVATLGGLSLIRDGAAPAAVAPTGLIIEQVRADDRVLPRAASLRGDAFVVPHGVRQVEVQVTVIDFHSSEPVILRHRIEGVDTDWRVTGRERTAVYSNLPPGRHSLAVQAACAGSPALRRETAVWLESEPRLWQTWPFRGAVAAAAVLALVGGYQWRLSRLRKGRDLQLRFARELIQSQEAERKRIAAELHDGLGQQLLVIKNNARLGLREPLPADQMRQQLELVSQMASACIEEVRTMARHLRPYQLDQLGLTKAIRALVDQVAQAASLPIQLDLDVIDGLLPAESEIHLYRIVQEGLNNLVRHAAASAAWVHIDHIGPQITVRIEDNGCGLAPERGQEPAGGFGLNNLRERAALLGGSLDVHSSPGGGVRLQVIVPLPRNPRPE